MVAVGRHHMLLGDILVVVLLVHLLLHEHLAEMSGCSLHRLLRALSHPIHTVLVLL